MKPRLTALSPRVGMIDTRRVRPAPKQAAPIYKSAQWQHLMRSIIAERGRRCQECRATGCKIFGDHVVELKDGGAPFERSNIRLLCQPCHNRKTADERTRRNARLMAPT